MTRSYRGGVLRRITTAATLATLATAVHMVTLCVARGWLHPSIVAAYLNRGADDLTRRQMGDWARELRTVATYVDGHPAMGRMVAVADALDARAKANR